MFVLRGQRAVQLRYQMIKHHSSPSKSVETIILLTCIQQVKMGRNSVVIIATRYGKDSPEIKSQWGKIFHVYPEWVSFPRLSSWCLALTTHPCLGMRLKKEYSNTSTTALGLHGLFFGELTLTLRLLMSYIYIWSTYS